jgi:hypothetical protein
VGHPAHPQLRFRVETGRPAIAEDVGLGLRDHAGGREAVEDIAVAGDGATSEAVNHAETRLSRSADDRVGAGAPLYLPQIPAMRRAESKRDIAVEVRVTNRTSLQLPLHEVSKPFRRVLAASR